MYLSMFDLCDIECGAIWLLHMVFTVVDILILNCSQEHSLLSLLVSSPTGMFFFSTDEGDTTCPT